MPGTRLLVFLLLAGLLSLADSPAAHAQSVVGIGTHSLDARSVSALRELGTRHARYTIYWKQWEGDRGYRKRVESELRRAEGAGIEILAVVHDQPLSFSFRNRAAAYRAYARTVGQLAAEFPQIRAWQLWNEMDVEGFTDLFGAGIIPMKKRGEAYGEMLRLAYPAIKRANPRAIVVTGGIASPVRDGFLDGLLESGAPFDALAIHAYGFPEKIPVVARGKEAKALLRKHRRGDVPLWLTEFGMESKVVAPGWDASRTAIDRYHLEAWREPIRWNDDSHVYDRMYGHVLQEGGDLSYDLVRQDGSLRPAGRWLQEYLRR